MLIFIHIANKYAALQYSQDTKGDLGWIIFFCAISFSDLRLVSEANQDLGRFLCQIFTVHTKSWDN